jgi:hypothetical protein
MLKKTSEMKDRNKMTELKEKISRPFAFLKISADPLVAHCQATQAHAETKACQRVAILPVFFNKTL